MSNVWTNYTCDGQMSLFDIMANCCPKNLEIPKVNRKGYIPAEQLISTEWEAWTYTNDNWTMRGGLPYQIFASLVKLPGNRLYVKDWFSYPFMYELKNAHEVDKMYQKVKKNIEKKIDDNDEMQRAWKIDYLPALEDMWPCKEEGRYSCREYAKKNVSYGYASATCI